MDPFASQSSVDFDVPRNPENLSKKTSLINFNIQYYDNNIELNQIHSFIYVNRAIDKTVAKIDYCRVKGSYQKSTGYLLIVGYVFFFVSFVRACLSFCSVGYSRYLCSAE